METISMPNCRCPAESGVKIEGKRRSEATKMEPNGCHTVKMEPEGCQNEPRDPSKHLPGNRVEKIMKKRSFERCGLHSFWSRIQKNTIPKNSLKTLAKKHRF